ncbi:MAG: protease complex subunit PrcB family protein [Gracilimonas sp.]|uniref:protease complex subunit PrcB family protein n=1 Tax=Gracilimonas sp. TaxID=1974203 RepID=UPI00198B60DA|nr:protease complex subunit PrcB family protein [Gracilimonas sp.]MBD3615573.1 protease complex subunit PrcB family protein [Gracilimonas sp.]
MRTLVLILLMTATVGMACSQVPGFNGYLMEEMEEIESGYFSNYPESGEIQKKIENQLVFEEEWKLVHEGMSPIPEVPKINFNTRDVILLMLETKPTGGFGIDNFEIYENDNQIGVRYSEVHPGDGCGTIQALTRPYKIVSIPKTEKDILFQKEETVINDCND